jgi:GTPase SAR1 family protein
LPQEDASKRAVDAHDASDLASDLNAKFIETSSKTGENVDQLFLMITQDFAEAANRSESGGGPTTGTVQPSVETTSKFSNCPC